MISHKYKCIFIHIPKTAGTSISKKLGLFDEKGRLQDHRPIIDIEPLSMKTLYVLGRNKDRLREFRRQLGNIKRGQRRLSKNQFDSYYKFTFVRNSWARVASWYEGVMRTEKIRESLGIPVDCSFSQFLINYPNQWHLKSQLYWITNANDQVNMDFIGDFNRLGEDWSKICNKLCIKDDELTKELMFGGKHTRYLELYSNETKDLVAKRYEAEIKKFGFKYGE